MKAVFDKELAEYLGNLGLLKIIENGSAECFICHKSVDFENLQAIVPYSGDIKFICNRANCLKAFTQQQA